MNVDDATCDMVRDYPGGAASLGPRVEKNATTLCHELAGTGTAKLGFKTWRLLMHRTADLRPLHALCTEFGGLFVKVPQLDDAHTETMGHVSQLIKEFSDVATQLSARLADGDVSDNDLHVLEREWLDLMGAGSNLLTHLKARNQAGKPAEQRSTV